jgi:hypothetical protein
MITRRIQLFWSFRPFHTANEFIQLAFIGMITSSAVSVLMPLISKMINKNQLYTNLSV